MIVQDESQKALDREIHWGSEDNDHTTLLINRHGAQDSEVQDLEAEEVEDMEWSSKKKVVLIVIIVIWKVTLGKNKTR